MTQGDKTLLETLETLRGSASTSRKFVDGRIKGTFVSDYVFNLRETLPPSEIQILEMRCKWFFRNERQENFSKTSQFNRKSTWNPPKRAPGLELFLSQTEKDILSVLPAKTTNYNLSKEQYLTMRNLQNLQSVVIKPAEKGSAVVVWDKTDYLKEAERQLT